MTETCTIKIYKQDDGSYKGDIPEEAVGKTVVWELVPEPQPFVIRNPWPEYSDAKVLRTYQRHEGPELDNP